MRSLRRYALLAATAGTVVAHHATGWAQTAGDVASNELQARVSLSHIATDDSQTAQHLSFSDLRLTADALHVAGAPLELHFDWRGRKSFDDLTDDRLTVTDAYAQVGERGDMFRLKVGRQQVREVTSAEIDGATAELHLGDAFKALLFGGLLPHPATSALNTDFYGGGGGYAYITRGQNHSGGAMVSLYGGGLDRIFVTQRSYLYLSHILQISGFAMVDLMAPQGLVSYGTESGEGADLTSLHGHVRLHPTEWLDSNLAVSHHHTVLPNKWWHDWLNEERRRRGYAIEGIEPVGTRISSVRWTNSFPVTRELIPYLRLRYQLRHTEEAHGWEGRGGLRWNPGHVHTDVNYTYRRYFEADNHLVELRGGYTGDAWGAEGGVTGLVNQPLDSDETHWGTHLHAMLWVAPGALLGGSESVQLLGQYVGFLEPELLFHTFYAGVSYRY